MGIIIDYPGLLTTIQDEGRFGYGQFGVTPSGPMDAESFQVANLLVGNDPGESALEATILGPTFHVTEDTILAITGADMSPTMTGVRIPMNRAIVVPAGSEVKLQAAQNGSRTYIAFQGGFDVPMVMGSRATSIQNHIGGFGGRKLEKGDVLALRPVSGPPQNLPHRAVSHQIRRKRENVVRVLLGPQEDCFTEAGLAAFLKTPYTVSRDFDRMGCRLEGQPIQHKTDGNIISDGIANGAVQVPTTGQPIIMLAERQSTGGYTKIATVISVDLPVVGQCCPGDVIRFQAVSLEEAHRLLKERRSRMEDLHRYLNEPPAVHTFRVSMKGKVYEAVVETINGEGSFLHVHN